MITTLTWGEIQIGSFIGCQRRIRALARGRRHRFGTPKGDLWGVDICAALSEMAAAKALGMYWSDDPKPDVDGDVGAYFVRWTEREDGCLILHREDPDDGPFILVVGTPPTFRLAGWLVAHDGKLDKFWRSDLARPCFMVPQSALFAMETFG